MFKKGLPAKSLGFSSTLIMFCWPDQTNYCAAKWLIAVALLAISIVLGLNLDGIAVIINISIY